MIVIIRAQTARSIQMLLSVHIQLSRSLTQPLLECILYLTQYLNDPGTLPSSANQCPLYLRSTLSRHTTSRLLRQVTLNPKPCQAIIHNSFSSSYPLRLPSMGCGIAAQICDPCRSLSCSTNRLYSTASHALKAVRVCIAVWRAFCNTACCTSRLWP